MAQDPSANSFMANQRWRRSGRPWTVTWDGRQAELLVLVHQQQVAVLVNRRPQGGLSMPTLTDRWSEVTLDSIPPITVAMVRVPQAKAKALVFVDGVSLKDGRTLVSWRQADLHPMDTFEDGMTQNPQLGWRLAAVLSVVILFASWNGQGRTFPALAGGILPALLACAWVLTINVAIIPLLAAQKDWSDAARRLLFTAVAVLPVVLLAATKNWQ